MTTPKILIPQPLPAIFEQARGEANWLIFAVGKPDKNGKRPKRPVAPGRPYVPVGREKAACMTYDKAVQRLQEFATMFGTLAEIDAKHKAYIEDRKKEGKTPGKPMDYDIFVLGYFAREDSALVALDFDNAVVDGVVDDFELTEITETSDAYIEISSSGTGLRVFMPREWGDDLWPTGEKNDVGLMGNGNGAAFALTFNPLLTEGEKKAGRDDKLVELALTRRGQGGSEGEGTDEEVADQVLDHGRIEVDTFVGEIMPLIENDERFDEFDAWFGMIRSAKEYYEVVDPDRLDEVKEAVEVWCESWEGGEHDAEKFEDVWNRKARDGAKSSLGSWVHHAQEAGFEFENEVKDVTPEEIDEFGFLATLDTEKVGKKTRAVHNYINAARVIEGMPATKDLIGYNVLTGGLLRLRDWGEGAPYPLPKAWTDRDDHKLWATVQGFKKGGSTLFGHYSIEAMKQGAIGAAKDVQLIETMIHNLPKWDGRSRIDSWLERYFGVERDDQTIAYARKFMIALIARGHARPDNLVQCDTVLLLTGAQGDGKSTFFRVLAGDDSLFTDHVGEVGKKEAMENIAGRWIVELSEGDVMTKASRTALKGFLTAQSDKFRAAYGRNVSTFPRSCVFVMPTNEEAILSDPSGSRRFWPVKVAKAADLDLLRVERGQMLAEALVAYRAGEKWHLSVAQDEERERRAGDYETHDPIEDKLLEVLVDVPEGQILTQTELLERIGADSMAHNSGAAHRMRDALHKLGWERAKSSGKRGYRRGSGGTVNPPMSDKALSLMKRGEVLELNPETTFKPVEDDEGDTKGQ